MAEPPSPCRKWWYRIRPEAHIGHLSPHTGVCVGIIGNPLKRHKLHSESAAAARDYGEMAGDYDEVVGRICHYFPAVRRWLDRRAIAGGRVLDLGCGTGLNTRHLSRELEVVALDLSPAMLRRTRKARPATRALLHDLNDPLPSGLGRFEVVLAIACLEFCRDLPALCRRLAKVLRPGGVALLSVPHRERGEPAASPLAKPFPDLIWHLFTQAEARAAIETAGLHASSGRLIPGWTVTPGRRLVRYALWTATAASRSKPDRRPPR